MKTSVLFLYTAFLLLCVPALSQDGSFDSTFNNSLQAVNHTGANSSLMAVKILENDKIMVGGYFTSYNGVPVNIIARLHPDGSLDTTFRFRQCFNFNYINIIHVQKDGKLIVGGYFVTDPADGFRRSLVRLHPDGDLDTTFHARMDKDGWINAIREQPDGKLILAGGFSFINGVSTNCIARLDADDRVDTTFRIGAGADQNVHSIILRKDGNILAGGPYFHFDNTPVGCIVNLTKEGRPDPAFVPGKGFNGIPMSIDLLENGKIITGGSFTTYNGREVKYFACLNADGSIDSTFKKGAGPDAQVNFCTVQPDGRIFVAGLFSHYNQITAGGLLRLHNDGSLDKSFVPELGPNSWIKDMAFEKSGKILIAGEFYSKGSTNRMYLARLNSTSTLTGITNLYETKSCFAIYPNPVTENFTLTVPEKETIDVYNSAGQNIKVLDLSRGEHLVQHTLPNGMYMFRPRSEPGKTCKVMIKR